MRTVTFHIRGLASSLAEMLEDCEANPARWEVLADNVRGTVESIQKCAEQLTDATVAFDKRMSG